MTIKNVPDRLFSSLRGWSSKTKLKHCRATWNSPVWPKPKLRLGDSRRKSTSNKCWGCLQIGKTHQSHNQEDSKPFQLNNKMAEKHTWTDHKPTAQNRKKMEKVWGLHVANKRNKGLPLSSPLKPGKLKEHSSRSMWGLAGRTCKLGVLCHLIASQKNKQ